MENLASYMRNSQLQLYQKVLLMQAKKWNISSCSMTLYRMSQNLLGPCILDEINSNEYFLRSKIGFLSLDLSIIVGRTRSQRLCKI